MKEYIGDNVFIRRVQPSKSWLDAPNPSAYIVSFERPEGDCEGVVSVWKSPDDEKYGRSVWKIEQPEPSLTLSPSIQCPRHPEEHGFIRNGKWEQA